jgi:Cu(I)/Ag(I) efflux system membrane fusion protein
MTAIEQIRPRGYGIILLTLLLGVVIGSLGFYWLAGASAPSSEGAKAKNDNPLYWVAPMDANFRRDKPGKSPMGWT